MVTHQPQRNNSVTAFRNSFWVITDLKGQLIVGLGGPVCRVVLLDSMIPTSRVLVDL